MTLLWICVFPGCIFLVYGIVMLATAYRHKRNIRLCTEAVNVRILSLEKRKNRSGYNYLYQVRYSRQGEKFTPSFTTYAFLGEVGEDTTLYIDPSSHRRFLVPDAPAQITASTMSGIVFLALGILFFVAGVDVMNS